MKSNRLASTALWQRLLLLATATVTAGAFVFGCSGLSSVIEVEEEEPPAVSEVTPEEVETVPTLTPEAEPTEIEATPGLAEATETDRGALAALYDRVSPGVVSIRVYVEQAGMTGQGAGSGFVLDEEGHIVTNHHVVADAEVVTVIFHDGFEARAETVGSDADSDLAVVKVDELPDDVMPLPLGGADRVQPGDWVVAIGNPFSLGGSMSLGIVSAVGRAIPARATPFRIPSTIQTDAAINPGNSGGPLLSMDGVVVGVNAAIASGESGVSSGVGFAIPSDVVLRVAPALIEEGSYVWPWLGVSGLPVNLLVQEANDLPTQEGAYIAEVIEGSPAAQAGIEGATRTERILGLNVPVGGDVVVEADGEAIKDFTELLEYVAFRQPGDQVKLTILRDGERLEVAVELGARPESPGQ